MVGDFFTKPLHGMQFIKFRDEIMNVNPTTYDDGSQDCRSVLNNITDGVTGHSDGTNGDETNTGWRTVESKQDIKEKRKRSRLSAVRTEDVSRVNEKVNCKRTSFGNE
jgi:ubiquitin C-terminal hydrolase